MTTKVCVGPCGEEKDVTEFYAYASSPPGGDKTCKVCRIGVSKVNFEGDRARHRRNRDKMDVARPHEYKARRILRAAVQAGKMVTGRCEVCGSDVKIEAHHDDYTKPLDVRWLCHTHHAEHHVNMRGKSLHHQTTLQPSLNQELVPA